jgi:aerobic carbon-monoxide dehydrogenase large subunit
VEWLGVEVDQVRLITGDTDLVLVGGGSHSGRSMRLGGVVTAKAADLVVETVSTPSFPYGCAVCEVEVDPDTGVVEIVRYTSVDDVGRAIKPMIVHGQTHGGIAQGVGQALWELCQYDAETGQMQSATFMDYAMPRADMLPAFTTEISEVPSTSNPLGLRGGGEGGATPAPAVVVNAVVDALAHLGVEHIEMPVTPERVWAAIRTAARRSV